jgi:Heterokaryon incompatibility protein (HET)
LDKSFEKVKQLIDNCDTHPSCHPATAVLPTRVIDLWPDESPRPGRLRLYESDRVTARYATLSYCWGGPQTFLATRETYRTLIDDGFDVEDLPPTIQDAICTTRRLGIRYLWVDALCIIQDSESDKRHEISQMRNIFRRSYVTAVAAAAKCISDGFLQRIDPVPLRGSLKLPLKLTDGTVGCVFLSRRHEATYIPIESVNNRAWTLEEKLLSRRILIFGEYSLRWQCQSESETIIGELFDSDLGGSDRLPAMLSSKDNASVDRFELREIQRAWAYILSEYGQRELTHTKDKLIALAGIAEEFQRFWGDKYLAGLWQRTLSRDLLWQIFKPSPRLKEYRAPSWSWASVDGEILSPLDERTITDFEVLACDVNLVSDMLPLGAVTGGRLKVKGVVRKAFYNSGYQLVLQTEAQPVENIGTVAPDALEEYPIGENELKMVWCLQISCESIGPTGMILIPAAGDVFQRIGRFTAPGKKDWFRNGRQQILVIK